MDDEPRGAPPARVKAPVSGRAARPIRRARPGEEGAAFRDLGGGSGCEPRFIRAGGSGLLCRAGARAAICRAHGSMSPLRMMDTPRGFVGIAGDRIEALFVHPDHARCGLGTPARGACAPPPGLALGRGGPTRAAGWTSTRRTCPRVPSTSGWGSRGSVARGSMPVANPIRFCIWPVRRPRPRADGHRPAQRLSPMMRDSTRAV